MSIADYAAWVAKNASPYQPWGVTKAQPSVAAGRWQSFWLQAPGAGATPTTAAAPTRSTTGALGQLNGGATAMRIASMEMAFSSVSGYLMIADRLSHQGGLSGILTGEQTTNLPTAALTRYTNGIGVFAALEIYTIIGTTGTTVTIRYTNTADTGGQVSPATVFGGSGFREVGKTILIPLAAGDIGVKSVQGVTLAATTGTAGAFGVTLFKPLMVFPIPRENLQFTFDSVLDLCNTPEIVDDACLFWMFTAPATSGVMNGQINFIED